MKKRLNRKGWVLLGSLILIVTVLGAAGLSLGRYYWATAVERSGVVYVPTGASFTQPMDSLRRHEVLRNETAFARMARRHGLDTALKAGRYELKEGMSYVRTVRMLRLGWQVPVRVTFNNIRTSDRLAGILARKLEPDSAAWLAALTSDSLARVYGLTPQTILTLCIPNTYEFFWNTSPEYIPATHAAGVRQILDIARCEAFAQRLDAAAGVYPRFHRL